MAQARARSNGTTLAEMVKLGKNMNVRQQAYATAQVYLRRFYLRVEVRRTNPYLVMATALYLACKMEECPQHIRVVVGELHHSCGGSFYLVATCQPSLPLSTCDTR